MAEPERRRRPSTGGDATASQRLSAELPVPIPNPRPLAPPSRFRRSRMIAAFALAAMLLLLSTLSPSPRTLSPFPAVVVGGRWNATRGGWDLGEDFAPTYDPPEWTWDAGALYAMCAVRLDFKVFVYDLDQEALVTPFLAAWGASYEEMMQYRTHESISRGMYSWPAVLEELWRLEGVVTDDPAEADVFYVPTRSFELWMVGKAREHALDEVHAVVGDYVAAVVGAVSEQYPYWNRHGGARHVLMEPNDMGRCTYYAPHVKELLWNVTILHPNGDSSADHAACLGGSSRDVIVPPRSVLGGLWEGDRHMQLLPTHTNSSWDRSFGPDRPSQRTATFSGSVQQGGEDYLFYSRGSRQYLSQRLAGVPGFEFRERFRSMSDYVESLSTSDFSLHMPGFMLWSPRLFDSMAFGAIPVIIGEYFVLPFEQFIPYDDFVVRVGWSQLRFLPEIIDSISPQRRIAMRTAMRKHVPFLLYSELAHQAVYASLCLKEKAISIHERLHAKEKEED